MDSDKENTIGKKEWTAPVLLLLDTRRTQSGSDVNRDNEDDIYTFPVLS